MPAWETTADWDNNQSQDLGHHEQPTGTDWAASDVYEGGYPTSIPSFSANLVAYYPLAETSGSTANEVTGTQSSDGAYQNSPTLAQTSGVFGSNSPQFEHSKSEFVDSNQSFEQSDDDFAFACWAKHNGTSWNTSFEDIINNWDGSNVGWVVQRDGNNSRLGFFIDENKVGALNDSNILDGNWHFIYAHQDTAQSEQRIRIDTTSGTKSATDSTRSSTANHFIGAEPGGGGSGQKFWGGWIHHVMIFDGALTRAEEDLLYNAPY